MCGQQSGKKTYGLDHFFSGLQQKVIPSLSFFVISLVSVKQRHSYPLYMEQTVRTAEEKAACKAKKEAQKAKAARPKRKPGRPKGSKNKDKTEISLNPELKRIQKMLAALLVRISSLLRPTYLALDGHFGNYPAYHMVRQTGLHLISKLRWDAALCFPYDGPYQGKGPHRKFGERVDYHAIPTSEKSLRVNGCWMVNSSSSDSFSKLSVSKFSSNRFVITIIVRMFTNNTPRIVKNKYRVIRLCRSLNMVFRYLNAM
jgi:hypothetical protein